jgi:hypothetical protein
MDKKLEEWYQLAYEIRINCNSSRDMAMISYTYCQPDDMGQGKGGVIFPCLFPNDTVFSNAYKFSYVPPRMRRRAQ